MKNIITAAGLFVLMSAIIFYCIKFAFAFYNIVVN